MNLFELLCPYLSSVHANDKNKIKKGKIYSENWPLHDCRATSYVVSAIIIDDAFRVFPSVQPTFAPQTPRTLQRIPPVFASPARAAVFDGCNPHYILRKANVLSRVVLYRGPMSNHWQRLEITGRGQSLHFIKRLNWLPIVQIRRQITLTVWVLVLGDF